MFMHNNKNVKKTDENKLKNKIVASIAGAVAGGVNGLFGGGGGMVIVPMLVYLLGMNHKSAHATAILIILPLSLVSSAFYFIFGTVDLSITIPVAVGVTIGGAIGALILSNSRPMFLVVVFSVVMAVAGVKMLFF